MCCEYFKPPRELTSDINRWDEGWVLTFTGCIFWLLSRISLYTYIVYFLEKKYIPPTYRYRFVDSYIIFFFLVASIIFTILFFMPDINICCSLLILIKSLVIYRLFETFQTWVRHFILPDWNPINVYRTLILVIIGYIEVIISYSFLYYIFNEQFSGPDTFREIFYYSICNSITIGYSAVTPVNVGGYAIIVTQFIFVLLFLTAVVNRVFSRKK
jgi:hypothetical protein